MSSYKVIFLGLSVAGPEEEVRLIKGLQKKFNLSPEKAESLLQRVPIVVKKNASKEEMERYVRAFEEIGGRVRMEEETIEPLTVSREIGHEQKNGPSYQPGFESKSIKETMLTCPKCGFEQPKTADRCIQCGVMISRYVQPQKPPSSYEGQAREIFPEEKSIPWEDSEGFIMAFFKTTREVLFSPTRFFKDVSKGEGYWSPFIYAMISGIIGFGISILWQCFFFSRWFPVQKLPALPFSLYFTVIIVALPFITALFLLIGSGVTHVSLMILGGSKGRCQATFRAISYSFSGYLFGVIPFIGSSIGGIYTLILAIIGLREGHSISTGKAVLAVFLPVILVAGLAILAAIFIPFLVRMAVSSTGV